MQSHCRTCAVLSAVPVQGQSSASTVPTQWLTQYQSNARILQVRARSERPPSPPPPIDHLRVPDSADTLSRSQVVPARGSSMRLAPAGARAAAEAGRDSRPRRARAAEVSRGSSAVGFSAAGLARRVRPAPRPQPRQPSPPHRAGACHPRPRRAAPVAPEGGRLIAS